MTSLSKIKIAVARQVVLEALSKYRYEVSKQLADCHLEVYNKEILLKVPATQEREICEELKESISYLDEFRDRIKEMEFE